MNIMQIWLVILIGLVGGTAVGLQSPIVGAMGQRVGGVASSFIVHLSGAIFSGLYLFLRGGEHIKDWTALPWYMLASGIFGLILYQTIYVTLPRLGSTMMMVLIIVGQLLVGVVIDQFGLLGVATRHIDLPRALGIVVLALGAYLIAK
jgi:bacterial/archaeal transporter family-2 protein